MARAFPATGDAGPRRSASSGQRAGPWRFVATVIFGAAFALYAWKSLTAGEPVGAGLLMLPVLIILTAPLLIRARRTEPTFDLAGLMATGLAIRVVGAYFRWAGAEDANIYHRAGAVLAQSFRAFDFTVNVGKPIPGTGGMHYLAGLVSVPANSNEFLEFLIFSWLGFWGCVLFYRAFVTALPGADRSRYAKLIFLWPSMAFWPSSIGKESWMILMLGLAALGAARVFTRHGGGYLALVAGLAGMTLLRPHVAMLTFVAFSVAFLIGRQHEVRAGAVTPASVVKVMGLLVILVVGSALATRTVSFLEIDDLSGSSVNAALETTRTKTAEGDAEFVPPSPGNPVGYATAFVTTLVRPLPIESQGAEQLLSAAEGMLLAGLIVTSWRRLATIPSRLRREPFTAMALAYLLMFVYAFSSIGNFGILARQRVQVLPFVFVLLALPAVVKQAKPNRGPTRPPTRRS